MGRKMRIRPQRARLAVSRNSCTEAGTSSYSAKRLRSSSAISTVTSRDQPWAVLKATMRTGLPYWSSIRSRISVSPGKTTYLRLAEKSVEQSTPQVCW